MAAAGCYLLWGLVPLYWKQLAAIDPLELIAHRHLWSLLLLGGLLVATGEGWSSALGALSTIRGAARLLVAALLLTTNWLVYVWGVNTGHILETSLGYFLVPLISVLAGRFLLGEQLRRVQWIAVGLAALGVGSMVVVVQGGRVPWIALALAGSWSSYSVMRKRSALGAIPGLAVETLLLAPVALGFLVWKQAQGTGALGRLDVGTHALLVSSGVITAIPLLLFAHAARRIRLSTLGVTQYLAPTLQWAIGVWVYHEPVQRERLFGFALIWVALGIYSVDNLRAAAAGVAAPSPVAPSRHSAR
ncbi:MAG: EamA family transporter RarD [Verrucomicrobia bacterium]|nr:EamA family transporter RarD [Verrucomicrobiota bacterium]